MLNADQTLAVTLAILVALSTIVVAVLAGGSFTPRPQGSETAGPSATCQEWTDGCVICVRSPGGAACSTPGIACVRGELRCVTK